MKRPVSVVAIFVVSFLSVLAGAAHSSEMKTLETFCDLKGFDSPLRQTVVVIDGRLIAPEHAESGINPKNRVWREFIANLTNARDPSIHQRFAPRERVTVAIAAGDGSGVRNAFTGCLPSYSKNEISLMKKGQSSVGAFFTGGVESRLKGQADTFRQALLVALAEAAQKIHEGGASGKKHEDFVDSEFVSSLSKGVGISQENGIPRFVIFSELGNYQFPRGDVPSVKKEGRKEGEVSGMNLMGAEVHLVGVPPSNGKTTSEYLKSFFLSAKGNVVTLTGIDGTLNSVRAPVSVAVYQGLIKYPDGPATMRVRLALDRNGTAVNSWAEVISDRRRFTPFGGVLTCSTEKNCSFVGDRIFAQVWSDDPSPDPEFATWMPFGGFREFSFTLKDGNGISGTISDQSGYVPGMEKGLPFELHKVKNGRF